MSTLWFSRRWAQNTCPTEMSGTHSFGMSNPTQVQRAEQPECRFLEDAEVALGNLGVVPEVAVQVGRQLGSDRRRRTLAVHPVVVPTSIPSPQTSADNHCAKMDGYLRMHPGSLDDTPLK